MQTSVRHRRLSIVLLIHILISTVGFSVDVHYCQNHLRGLSLIGTSESCDNTHSATLNKSNCCQTIDAADCCQDERFINQLEYDAPYNTQVEIELLTNDVFLNSAAHQHSKPLSILCIAVDIDPPPLTGQKIRIMLQSFRC